MVTRLTRFSSLLIVLAVLLAATPPARADDRSLVEGLMPGIEAAVLRAPWYELAELAEETESGYGVWSGGAFFHLGARDDDS